MTDNDLWTLRISARARREIAEAQEWWKVHRDKAPQALQEELREAFELLLQTGLDCPARLRARLARISHTLSGIAGTLLVAKLGTMCSCASGSFSAVPPIESPSPPALFSWGRRCSATIEPAW